MTQTAKRKGAKNPKDFTTLKCEIMKLAHRQRADLVAAACFSVIEDMRMAQMGASFPNGFRSKL